MNRLPKIAAKITLTLVLATLSYNLFGPPALVQAQDNSLTQAFILFATDQKDPQRLDQVQSIVNAGGGRVTHTFPNQAFIVNIPEHTIQQLATLPGVVGVYTRPVELAQMDVYGPNARRVAGVWNSLIAPQADVSNTDLPATEHPDDHEDVFVAPDLPPADAPSVAGSSSITPGYYQTSEFMAGSVAVGIVLVESDGTTDPSSEDWTNDEKQLVFSEIVAALDWWARLEPRANLSFVYDDHFSNPLPTKVEPITRPYHHQQYWIADALSGLGYNASSYFTRVRDYNNNLRDTHHTDWAFTIFVVDSSNDADNRFSDRFFAYAYLGGPFTVLTYGNNGYGASNMDAVATHEIGHIFRALDQYSSAYQSCTRRSGYLYVENQNSQYGSCASNVTSIMRGQTYPYQAEAIDSYAAGQIGWRDSDQDNILDPLDTDLPVHIDALSQEGNRVNVSGTADIVPYPSPIQTDITINTLTGVQYRIGGGNWQQAAAGDGAFDTTTESYQFAVSSLSSGIHTLEIAAVDSAGNVSDVYATENITVIDPMDGGLNTELRLSDSIVAAGGTSTLYGLAYHMQGGLVTGVEYRINGGGWQSVDAQDGSFDSGSESFVLDIHSLESGIHLIEARATDNAGNVELNFASQEITVAKIHTVFLPITMAGS